MDSVNYLGYIFDKDGVRPNTDKIRAIIDAPTPDNVKQVQIFGGLCNYYHRFVRNFSTVFAPLYKLLKLNVHFMWGKEQENCFNFVKRLFKCDKLFRLFDPTLETALECDASAYGIGAVLMQKHADAWHPLQFATYT